MQLVPAPTLRVFLQEVVVVLMTLDMVPMVTLMVGVSMNSTLTLQALLFSSSSTVSSMCLMASNSIATISMFPIASQ